MGNKWTPKSWQDFSAAQQPEWDNTESYNNVIQEIIKTITSATSSIYVMHFWFSWKPIADALIDAHKKGVKINVLTDQRSLVKYMQDNQTTYSISVLEFLS